MASGLAELALQAVELHALPKGRTAAVFQTVAQPADKSFERALAAEVGIAFGHSRNPKAGRKLSPDAGLIVRRIVSRRVRRAMKGQDRKIRHWFRVRPQRG